MGISRKPLQQMELSGTKTDWMHCLPVYVLYKMIWKLRIEDSRPLECDVMHILACCSLHSEANENQKLCDFTNLFHRRSCHIKWKFCKRNLIYAVLINYVTWRTLC